MDIVYIKLDNVEDKDLLYTHIMENPNGGMTIYHDRWLPQEIKDYIEEELDSKMVGYRVWTRGALSYLDCNKISRMAFAKVTLNCRPDELDFLEKTYTGDLDMTLYNVVFDIFR